MTAEQIRTMNAGRILAAIVNGSDADFHRRGAVGDSREVPDADTREDMNAPGGHIARMLAKS